jgi:hypothetical protein
MFGLPLWIFTGAALAWIFDTTSFWVLIVAWTISGIITYRKLDRETKADQKARNPAVGTPEYYSKYMPKN